MASLLIVENNRFFRRLLTDFLGRQFPGLSIEEADEGEMALSKMLTQPPDIVLMDVQLSGHNGLKLTRQIKTANPQTSVLLFSSYDVPELQQIARDHGADRLIQKDEMMNAGIPEFIESVLANLQQPVDGPRQPCKAKRKASTRPPSYQEPQIQAATGCAAMTSVTETGRPPRAPSTCPKPSALGIASAGIVQ